MRILVSCLAVSVLVATALLAAVDAPKLSTAAGPISSISTAANSLIVKVPGQKGESQEMTFVVEDDSKIVKSGAAVTLADLKEGDRVTVTYHAMDGKNVVVNIGVEVKS